MADQLKTKWHCITSGDREKIPILFLHGFMGSCHIWEKTFASLSEEFYAIAVDLPGHGKTEADLKNLNFDSLANALIDFLTNISGRQWLICGYSLGGRVALYTALKYPDKFAGLVLESCHPGIEDENERIKRLQSDSQLAEKMRQQDILSFLRDWYRQPVFDYLSDDLKQKIIAKKSSGQPDRLASVLTALSQGIQLPLWDRMSGWDIPALILAGEKDSKYAAIANRMAGLMTQSELVVVPSAGHIVHLENHNVFMSALNSFLSSYIL